MALLISRNTDSEDLPITCMLDNMPRIMQCTIQSIGLFACSIFQQVTILVSRCMLRGLCFVLDDEDKVLHDTDKLRLAHLPCVRLRGGFQCLVQIRDI